jgi:hypothetical protein
MCIVWGAVVLRENNFYFLLLEGFEGLYPLAFIVTSICFLNQRAVRHGYYCAVNNCQEIVQE